MTDPSVEEWRTATSALLPKGDDPVTLPPHYRGDATAFTSTDGWLGSAPSVTKTFPLGSFEKCKSGGNSGGGDNDGGENGGNPGGGNDDGEVLGEDKVVDKPTDRQRPAPVKGGTDAEVLGEQAVAVPTAVAAGLGDTMTATSTIGSPQLAQALMAGGLLMLVAGGATGLGRRTRGAHES